MLIGLPASRSLLADELAQGIRVAIAKIEVKSSLITEEIAEAMKSASMKYQ